MGHYISSKGFHCTPCTESIRSPAVAADYITPVCVHVLRGRTDALSAVRCVQPARREGYTTSWLLGLLLGGRHSIAGCVAYRINICGMPAVHELVTALPTSPDSRCCNQRCTQCTRVDRPYK